jgi:murein DD-endopeptidase MepM/ murein hydrolase activator NlpD
MKLASSVLGGLRYWLCGGIDLKHSRGMNATILSPISGKVIAAKDGWPERKRATPLDLVGAGIPRNEADLRRDLRPLAGNYLIIEGHEGFVFLAHATTHSICVSEGEHVHAGQPVAKVGNTGNSTAPHLHFHLMDCPDPWNANGLPSCFLAYDRLASDVWERVANGIPGPKERLRYAV